MPGNFLVNLLENVQKGKFLNFILIWNCVLKNMIDAENCLKDRSSYFLLTKKYGYPMLVLNFYSMKNKEHKKY